MSLESNLMRAPWKLLAPVAAAVALAASTSPAEAGTKPARQALNELNEGKSRYNVVQNRFFLKEKRFEVAPVGGYVPNNPFAKRYVAGLLTAYHFSETFAAEAAFLYSPDLGEADLKDLTHTLVGIAHEGNADVQFQQPVDKMVMGATFAARWAPVYGKINILGERVINFDTYLTAGAGLLSIKEYYATYDEAKEGVAEHATSLGTAINKSRVPVNLGLGMDFFVSSSIALKIDARNYLYFDKKPQYDPEVPVEESRLYNNFVASVGVGIFFPSMKTRDYDF
jgi:outer membrane beta-barrel protein